MKDDIYAFYHRNTDELQQLANGKESLKIAHCDIASTGSVKCAMKEALQAGKPIDILYNVAGMYCFEDKVGLRKRILISAPRCITLMP
jgi:Short-chain alcohol dehydrogenase of unknown specificity